MKQLIKSAVFALCMMALVIGAATETDIDYNQVSEDMDIMAAIIDKTLQEKFPSEYRASSLFRDFRGCQGIYLKGYGAVFFTSVDFPVAEMVTVKEEASPDDVWQRTKYELRGVSSGKATGEGAYQYYYYTKSPGGNYNSGKVEELKKQLLELIASYGHNIRQMGSQESIAIAIRGTTTGSAQPYGLVRDLRTGTAIVTYDQSSGLQFQGDQSVTTAITTGEASETSIQSSPTESASISASTKPASAESPAISSATAVSVPAAQDAAVAAPPGSGSISYWSTDSDIGSGRHTTMIIKVNRENIMAYKDGKLNLDEFMKQAEITQYPVSSRGDG